MTERRLDDDGVELSQDDRKDDYLERLALASEAPLGVRGGQRCTTPARSCRTCGAPSFPDTVWGRFAAGREGTVRWYARVAERMRAVGFAAPIVDELAAAAEELGRR